MPALSCSCVAAPYWTRYPLPLLAPKLQCEATDTQVTQIRRRWALTATPGYTSHIGPACSRIRKSKLHDDDRGC